MKKTIYIKGMHCTSCEELIKDSLLDIDGVKQVKVSLLSEAVVIEFDEAIVKESKIVDAIVGGGFRLSEKPAMKMVKRK